MQSVGRALRVLILGVSFAVTSLPVFAQQVIATVPVASRPYTEAVNAATNKIYVANACGNDPTCAYPYNPGMVTVIDGMTNNILASINVGYFPVGVGVNSLTNKIYVANACGNDPACASGGTVMVIDGASNVVIATVTAGNSPFAVAVNTVTNKIYVVNGCGDPSCQTSSGSVTVIDGATSTVAATVPVGSSPYAPKVNSVTNQIYVPNGCGNDPTCNTYNGTVTVIDGATNNSLSVNVGAYPDAVDVNSVTNKIYVANDCGSDPTCQADSGTVTVIDGGTLVTTDLAIGAFNPQALAVNSVTNKVYVAGDCFRDPSCGGYPNGSVTVIDGGSNNVIAYVAAGLDPHSMAVNSVTDKIYVANRCGSGSPCKGHTGTVTVVDGVTLATANVGVGSRPNAVAVNSATNSIYVPNLCGNDPCIVYSGMGTVSVIDGTPPSPLQFVPLAQPCRAVDTRPSRGGGGPIQGGTHQSFSISGSPACGTLPSAAAYAMNVTVLPQGKLGYLTVWPAGQPQPLASLMNSLDGRVKANAAIMPAGTNGQVSVYATDTTQVIIDINGYFTPPSSSTLAFYPLAPCRVADTRKSDFPQGLGTPSLTGGQERVFPILNASTTCNIPTIAQAYSLNLTVVPQGSLGYLTVWPTGQSQPTASTLNDVLGQVIANAAIVAGDSSGQMSAYATSNTDLIIDINGYFAPAGTGGLSLYGLSPCRVIDTRKIGSGNPFTGTLSPPVDVVDAGCAASSLAQAYVFNASVIPVGSLGYLTLWPDGQTQPTVSTLNSVDGSITSNMAIVPTTKGSVDAFVTDYTQLFLDLSSYFAP